MTKGQTILVAGAPGSIGNSRLPSENERRRQPNRASDASERAFRRCGYSVSSGVDWGLRLCRSVSSVGTLGDDAIWVAAPDAYLEDLAENRGRTCIKKRKGSWSPKRPRAT